MSLCRRRPPRVTAAILSAGRKTTRPPSSSTSVFAFGEPCAAVAARLVLSPIHLKVSSDSCSLQADLCDDRPPVSSGHFIRVLSAFPSLCLNRECRPEHFSAVVVIVAAAEPAANIIRHRFRVMATSVNVVTSCPRSTFFFTGPEFIVRSEA